jgi:hypothetical protein
VVCQRYFEVSNYGEHSICNFNFTFYDPRLFLAVNVQIPFCANLICPICCIIDLFNDLPGKGNPGVLITFQVFFIKMFALKVTIETYEGLNYD